MEGRVEQVVKTVGIIAEYQLFHRGHAAQIQYIRSKLGPRSKIVIALSSYFTQRGLPALMSPKERAAAALQAGADLVFLLPQAFSSAEARHFAKGAVCLLAKTGVIDLLAFGSEVMDKDVFEDALHFLCPESAELQKEITEGIKAGLSPFQARQEALRKLSCPEEVISMLEQANARLGCEYLCQLKQLSRQNLRIGYFLCPRKGQEEKDLEISKDDFASATALRSYLEQRSLQAVFRISDVNKEILDLLSQQLPNYSFAELIHALSVHPLPTAKTLDQLAYRALLNIDNVESLRKYRYFQNGLAERLLQSLDKQQFQKNSYFDPTMLSSVNFPPGRIRRALLSLHLGIHQDFYKQHGDEPAFLLPLAFNNDGRYLLRKMQDKCSLPLLSQISSIDENSSTTLKTQILLERRAEILWKELSAYPVSDLLSPPVQIKKRPS